MKSKDTEKIKFYIHDDGILHIECLPGTVMTIDEGKLSTKIGLELTDGEAMPLLCDLQNVVKMNQECRNYFAGPVHADSPPRDLLEIRRWPHHQSPSWPATQFPRPATLP